MSREILSEFLDPFSCFYKWKASNELLILQITAKKSPKITIVTRYIDKHSKYYEAEIVKKFSPPIIPIAIIIGLNSIALNTL